MNERIKELAEQAGFMEAWFSESGDDCEREIKKLAQLIVQECIEQCTANDSNDEWDKGVRWAANQIKEHFGVEE